MARGLREKTEYPGVYTRISLNPITRQPDVAFDTMHKEKVEGVWKPIYTVVGWKSEKMTAKKASQIRQDAETDRRRGLETPAQEKARKAVELTIADFFDTTVMNHQKTHNKTHAKAAQRFNDHVRPYFGETRFSDVTVKAVCDWRDDLLLKKKLSPATVSIVMNLMHQCFRMASALDVIKHNLFDEKALRGGKSVPKINIPKPRNNNRERALTREEADALIRMARTTPRKAKAPYDPDMADIIVVALKHGLRASEIMNLQWKDIVFEFDHIMLWEQKSGRKQPFKMADTVREIMSKKKGEKDPSPEDLVFPAPMSGKKRCALNSAFKAVVDRCELNKGREDDPYQHVVFHTLRHTFATWLAQDSVDIKTIQKLMRHADIKDTLRYLNFAPNYSDQVVSRLDASWAVPSEVEELPLPPNVLPIRGAR